MLTVKLNQLNYLGKLWKIPQTNTTSYLVKLLAWFGRTLPFRLRFFVCRKRCRRETFQIWSPEKGGRPVRP